MVNVWTYIGLEVNVWTLLFQFTWTCGTWNLFWYTELWHICSFECDIYWCYYCSCYNN